MKRLSISRNHGLKFVNSFNICVLVTVCLLGACAKNSKAIQLKAKITPQSSLSNAISPQPHMRPRRRYPRFGRPSGPGGPTRPQGIDLRVISLERISTKVSEIAPRLLSSTGPELDSTPAFIFGAITDQGKIIDGYGDIKLNSFREPNEDTKFGIGSLTKVLTGIILAEAVVNGEMVLDNSANLYLPPDLQLPSNNITLRQLVTHTSGLPNYPENLSEYRDFDGDGINDSDQYSPGRNYSRKELSEWLESKPRLNFEPGSSGQYSNLGFGILSLALENNLKYSSFEKMNEEIVTSRLSMTRTHTNKDNDKIKFDSNQAQGYSINLDNGSLHSIPYSDMGILEGAGELISTASDILSLLETLSGIKNSILTPALEEASKPLANHRSDKIAYGFKIVKSSKGGVYYMKSGSTAGFSSIMLWRSNPKVGIVLLANRGNFKKLNKLGVKIIEAMVVNSNLLGQNRPNI